MFSEEAEVYEKHFGNFPCCFFGILKVHRSVTISKTRDIISVVTHKKGIICLVQKCTLDAILCKIFVLCSFQLESVKGVKCAKTNKFREVTVQDQCDRIKMYSARDNTRMGREDYKRICWRWVVVVWVVPQISQLPLQRNFSICFLDSFVYFITIITIISIIIIIIIIITVIVSELGSMSGSTHPRALLLRAWRWWGNEN